MSKQIEGAFYSKETHNMIIFSAELSVAARPYGQTSSVCFWCGASPVSSAGIRPSHWWCRCQPFCSASVSKWPQPQPPERSGAGTGPRGDMSAVGRRRRWQRTKARPGAEAGTDGWSWGREPGWTGQVWAAWRWARSTETEETRGETPLPHSWILPKRYKRKVET